MNRGKRETSRLDFSKILAHGSYRVGDVSSCVRAGDQNHVHLWEGGTRVRVCWDKRRDGDSVQGQGREGEKPEGHSTGRL